MSYLRISNVSKNYKDGENVYQALKNINLKFDKNEFVAILGESGSGKSTLLNLIIGISEITKGNIYFNDESIASFSNKRMNQYRKKDIGIIFQKYNLINAYNLFDNLLLVKEKKTPKSKIIKLLKVTKLFNKRYKKVSECSGGENQRIALIRAIVNDPKILILDEPTGALDQENSEILLEYIASIKDDRLILFVTHNRELAFKYASRIIELKDGEVIKDESNEINNSSSLIRDNNISSNMKLIYKLKFVFNLIIRKKGRFLLSILSSFFLLFFISISIIAINISNEYINYSFLSSLDANVIDLKSYRYDSKELKEQVVPDYLINSLNDNNLYTLRLNYNNYINKSLLNNIEFKTLNKKINLSNILFSCSSLYCSKELKMGKYPTSVNEIVINSNLYSYLSDNDNNVINKKITVKNKFLDINELKIIGVVNNSIMNSELTIYFDYSLIKELLKDIDIYDYQVDVINLKDIKEVIDYLKNSNLYLNKEDIKEDELNFSIEYSEDLDNYNTFYDLIRLAKVVVLFFLGLCIAISIMLLSNVIYSFVEEEKKNLSILKVLGFSYFDISYIPLIICLIIVLLSYGLIILFINYFKDYLNNFIFNLLNIEVNVSLSNMEYIFILIIAIFFAFMSSVFPLIKLRKISLDQALKEE